MEVGAVAGVARAGRAVARGFGAGVLVGRGVAVGAGVGLAEALGAGVGGALGTGVGLAGALAAGVTSGLGAGDAVGTGVGVGFGRFARAWIQLVPPASGRPWLAMTGMTTPAITTTAMASDAIRGLAPTSIFDPVQPSLRERVVSVTHEYCPARK